MFAVDSIILVKIARPQEEERKEKAKEERKAKEKVKAKGIRKTFMAGKAKACRHWISGANGVGVKEEESTVNPNHHRRQNHGCNFNNNNHPGSAAWAIGVDNRHGEDINKRGRGEIR